MIVDPNSRLLHCGMIYKRAGWVFSLYVGFLKGLDMWLQMYATGNGLY